MTVSDIIYKCNDFEKVCFTDVLDNYLCEGIPEDILNFNEDYLNISLDLVNNDLDRLEHNLLDCEIISIHVDRNKLILVIDF